MSADVLRRASTAIREEWGGDWGTAWNAVRNFHLAVADWLSATALEFDALGNPDLSGRPLDGRRTSALIAARAYLGESGMSDYFWAFLEDLARLIRPRFDRGWWGE